MKKWMISAALGAMLVSGGIAVAQSDGVSPPRGPMAADANGDGALTKAEVTAGLDKAFAKLDANRDGQVTQEERQALRQMRLDDRFAKLDTDRNGQISKAEFQAARDARKEARKDLRGERRGDQVGRHGGHHGHHGRGGGMGLMGGRGADADKNGVLTRAEFMARPMAMFDRADANKDGKMTADEMKAARPARGMGHHGDAAPAQK